LILEEDACTGDFSIVNKEHPVRKEWPDPTATAIAAIPPDKPENILSVRRSLKNTATAAAAAAAAATAAAGVTPTH
jgi:hypothetical protein